MRLLFSSIHCHLDPSSGAALCTRELLELLAARGIDCRVLTTGILDPERETSLDEVLATLELPVQRFQAELGTGRAAEVIDLSGQRGPGHAHAHSLESAERSPDPRESAIFLELAERRRQREKTKGTLLFTAHGWRIWGKWKSAHTTYSTVGNSNVPFDGDGKRDITDIDCLHGEVASVTATLTLDASGLGAKDVLFGDVPFPLPRSKGIATAASSSETARTATAGCRSISRR